MTVRSARADVDAFLASHRIAIAGVSRTPTDYSRLVFEEFRKRDYDVVPVNPQSAEIAGLPCAPAIKAIAPPPGAALLLIPDTQLAAAVDDCLQAGVQRLWFRHGAEDGEACRAAIGKARAAGATVVAGECPLMYLPDAGWIHKAHGAVRHLLHRDPV